MFCHGTACTGTADILAAQEEFSGHGSLILVSEPPCPPYQTLLLVPTEVGFCVGMSNILVYFTIGSLGAGYFLHGKTMICSVCLF